MAELSQLGMADVARRSRVRWIGRVSWLLLFVMFAFVMYRNFGYIKRGMLAPNFALIRQHSYNFKGGAAAKALDRQVFHFYSLGSS